MFFYDISPFYYEYTTGQKKKIKIKNWDWLILDFPWTKLGVVLVTIFMQNSEKKNKLMLQRETTLTPQNNLDIFPPSSRDGQNWVLKTAWKSIIGHLNREYSISFNENYWKGSNKWRFEWWRSLLLTSVTEWESVVKLLPDVSESIWKCEEKTEDFGKTAPIPPFRMM